MARATCNLHNLNSSSKFNYSFETLLLLLKLCKHVRLAEFNKHTKFQLKLTLKREVMFIATSSFHNLTQSSKFDNFFKMHPLCVKLSKHVHASKLNNPTRFQLQLTLQSKVMIITTSNLQNLHSKLQI